MALNPTQKMVSDAIYRLMRKGGLTLKAALDAKAEIDCLMLAQTAKEKGRIKLGRKYGEGGKTTQPSERVGNAISTRIEAAKVQAPKAHAQSLLKTVEWMIKSPKLFSRDGLDEFERIKAQLERVLTLTKEKKGTTPMVQRALKEVIAGLLDNADTAIERATWKYGKLTDADVKSTPKAAHALIEFAKTLKKED